MISLYISLPTLLVCFYLVYAVHHKKAPFRYQGFHYVSSILVNIITLSVSMGFEEYSEYVKKLTCHLLLIFYSFILSRSMIIYISSNVITVSKNYFFITPLLTFFYFTPYYLFTYFDNLEKYVYIIYTLPIIIVFIASHIYFILNNKINNAISNYYVNLLSIIFLLLVTSIKLFYEVNYANVPIIITASVIFVMPLLIPIFKIMIGDKEYFEYWENMNLSWDRRRDSLAPICNASTEIVTIESKKIEKTTI